MKPLILGGTNWVALAVLSMKNLRIRVSLSMASSMACRTLSVLEDGDFLVDAQVHHGERVALDDLLAALDELIEVPHRDGVVTVDLAVQQGLKPGLRMVVRNEVDGGDLAACRPSSPCW